MLSIQTEWGGALVKECLKKKYSILPEYTIDNKTNNGTTILSIEQAKRRNNEGISFLICSWNDRYYMEIRQVIYEAFPEEQIIDIFKEEGEILPTEKEISDVLYYVEGYIE